MISVKSWAAVLEYSKDLFTRFGETLNGAASYILSEIYGVCYFNNMVFIVDEWFQFVKGGIMAKSEVAEKAIAKLSEDSSAVLTKEESEAICLDLIDELGKRDGDLNEAMRLLIGLCLPKVGSEAMDKIAYKLAIYDL